MPYKVFVNYGRTVNRGNYESTRIDFGIEAEVPEGEDPRALQDELFRQVKEEVLEREKSENPAFKSRRHQEPESDEGPREKVESLV